MKWIKKLLCKLNYHFGLIKYTHYGDDGFYEVRECESCGLNWKRDINSNKKYEN